MGQRLLYLTLAFCFLLIYLLTLTDVHTYDALSYILDVDRKPWVELFHPHHLAYGPFGALIRDSAGAVGWQGSAERLLQGANALAGAAGVGLFGALAAWATATTRPGRTTSLAGLAAALLLGTSYAYWYYAVEVEVYTIAAVFLAACLWLMLALARNPSPRMALALGVAQACAVLFHQTNVLLCVPALVALVLGIRAAQEASPQGWRLASLIRHPSFFAYALPLALIVGGAYLWVGVGVSGFRSWGELYAWAAGYTTTGLWGGPLDGTRLQLLGEGLAESFAQPAGALAGGAVLATLLACVSGLRTAPRGAVAICLSWLAVYGAFFFWWEPDNIEFWIASLPPFYLLAVLAAHGSSHPRGSAGAGALLASGMLMLAINAPAIDARGDAGRDRQRVVAMNLAEGSAPGDLLVAPDGVVELYLPFYEGRDNVASLSQAMAATSGDWRTACELLRGRIETALTGGYAVRVAEEARRPEPAPPGEPPTPAERFGLSPDTVAACYATYEAAFEPHSGPPGSALPGYLQIPGAQTLANGPGWSFTRGRWGWQARNAAETVGNQPGWAFIPGVDPALISPPVSIDTGRFGAVEVRLAAATAARDAQLFFLDEAGRSDEARSLRWTLQPGPGPNTYRLDLRGAPGWAGMVTGLRLDPVGAGDGGVVVVESIRLLP